MKTGRVLFLLTGACALSACASSRIATPEIAKSEFVSAFQVMKSARCEINAAAAGPLEPSLQFDAVSMDFVLQVVETRGVTGAPQLVVPVDGASLTLGGTIGRTNKGTRIINMKFVHRMNNELDCSDNLLTGGLGVAGWIELAKGATTSTFRPTSLSQKITFDITRAANGQPQVTRSIGSGTRTLGSTLTNDRALKHEVNLTIVPNSVAPKTPAKPKTAAAARDTFRQEALDSFIQRFDDDDNDE